MGAHSLLGLSADQLNARSEVVEAFGEIPKDSLRNNVWQSQIPPPQGGPERMLCDALI